MKNCNACGVEIDYNPEQRKLSAGIEIALDKPCYHRCVECGQPFYTFFDEQTGIKDDYKCAVCGDPFVYSWSLVSQFMSCPKYTMFNTELGRSISTLAMDFGSCLHRALDMLQATRDLTLTIDNFRHDYIGNIEIDSMRTPDYGATILTEFWGRYHNHPLMTSEGFNEKSVAVEMRPGLLYSGKVDRITPGNVIDYKSSSFFGRENFERTYEMNHQFTGYQWLAGIITGQNFEDINVWLIKVSKGTKRRTAAEKSAGREEYDDACDFKIIPQRRRPHQIDRFLKTIDYAVRWWNDCRRTGFYPEWSPYCFHYNRDCMYLDLCQMDIPEAVRQIKYHFPLRVWDPLAGEEVLLQEKRRIGT